MRETKIFLCTNFAQFLCIVPSEHAVISKERRSGVYHLSAYYLAKTVSELPLVLLQPSLYLLISYWIVGLNGPAGFCGTWFILVTSSIVAQVNKLNICTSLWYWWGGEGEGDLPFLAQHQQPLLTILYVMHPKFPVVSALPSTHAS